MVTYGFWQTATDSMWCGSRLLMAFVSILCLVAPASIAANQALDPSIIIDLKKGHMKTCPDTISAQLRSIGVPVVQSIVLRYCECLGTFYFNDLTKSEYSQMLKSGYSLPDRIALIRRQIQEHCVVTHF